MARVSKSKTLTSPQEDRLRLALSLGLRASTGYNDRRHKTWWNTDAEVQGQAVRAIQAFLNAHKSKLQAVERTLLDEIVSALEGLIKAESEQVYTLAADVAAALINAGGTSVLGFKIQGLCASLVHLLSRTRSNTSCATALRIIINDAPKLKTYLNQEDLWEILKGGNTLSILASQIQTHENFDGEGAASYVSVADLCTAILHWQPATRFVVGNNHSFRKSVLMQCRNSNEAVCCAALRLCAALALCGGVALLQVEDKEELCNCLVANTNPSKSHIIRSEAFHFLYILSRLTCLGISMSEQLSDLICANLTNAILEGSCVSKTRWPPHAKKLVLEASQAAQGLLCLPGKHHHSFWRAGFITAICSLLLDLYDRGAISHSKPAKYDQVLGPVFWDALSWLSINAPAMDEQSHVRSKEQEAFVSKTIGFACAVLLKVVDRRGIRTESNDPQDHNYAGLEGVAICKAMLFLLFSPSCYLASAAKQILEQALQQHGYDWLLPSVSRLSLLLSLGAASDNMIAVMSLMAVCCLSISAHCRQQLLQSDVLDILIEAVKCRTLSSSDKHHTSVTAIKWLWKPLVRNICCLDEQNAWEGNDPILFLSLWAFARLARGSDTAKAINTSLKKRLSNWEEWASVRDKEVDSCFFALASSTNTATGLRWWASCCLACCGAYGFPSERSQLWRLFNDSLSADIRLLFFHGGHMHAHKVILAAKCPALLPFPTKADYACQESSMRQLTVSEVSCPLAINLSARIHEAPLKSLLEYIYKGFVFIDEGVVSEVKLLAKRCGMDTFVKLLHGKVPVWGSTPDTLDFTTSLGSVGCTFSDISFQDKDGSQVGCIAAKGDEGHQHAHRAILSCQCSYFNGLFRSGMQDSSFKVLNIPLHVEGLKKLLYYLYSTTLPRKRLPEAGCMWSSSPRVDQVKYLNCYIELAQLAELWLLEDLKEQCLSVILDKLENHTGLGPDVIKLAAVSQLWWLVELAAKCIAKDYPRMRESGKLDVLDDYLVDTIRAAHVRISINGKCADYGH